MFAPSAQARLLYTNEDYESDADRFIIDFDNDAENGDIELQFGKDTDGLIRYNTGSGFFLGDDATFSGNITIEAGNTLNGFMDASIGEGISGTYTSGSTLSGAFNSVDLAIQELYDRNAPIFQDTDFVTPLADAITFSGSEANIAAVIEGIDSALSGIFNGSEGYEIWMDVSSGAVAYYQTGSGGTDLITNVLEEFAKQLYLNESDIADINIDIDSITGEIAQLETDYQAADTQLQASIDTLNDALSGSFNTLSATGVVYDDAGFLSGSTVQDALDDAGERINDLENGIKPEFAQGDFVSSLSGFISNDPESLSGVIMAIDETFDSIDDTIASVQAGDVDPNYDEANSQFFDGSGVTSMSGALTFIGDTLAGAGAAGNLGYDDSETQLGSGTIQGAIEALASGVKPVLSENGNYVTIGQNFSGAVLTLDSIINELETGVRDITFNGSGTLFGSADTLSGALNTLAEWVDINQVDIGNLEADILDLQEALSPDFSGVNYTNFAGDTLTGVIANIDAALTNLSSSAGGDIDTLSGALNNQAASIAQRAEFPNALVVPYNNEAAQITGGSEDSNGTLEVISTGSGNAYSWTTQETSAGTYIIDVNVDVAKPENFSGFVAGSVLDIDSLTAGSATIEASVEGGAFDAAPSLTTFGPDNVLNIIFRMMVTVDTDSAELQGFTVPFEASYSK